MACSISAPEKPPVAAASLQVECCGIAAAFFQVNGEEGCAHVGVGQIHEENFIEAAFAEHLGRQVG
ncbi:MAG TPA: hypothetical protein VK703_15685, partial [Candidatus Acidoferrales bacterium]|nr:hypothetical protein [Candidatus Acidoferrales bacterium]